MFSYEYDCAFAPGDQQRKVIYYEMIAPLTDSFFRGYNATVLAYGQTGSGKTHTMGSSEVTSSSPVSITIPQTNTSTANKSSIPPLITTTGSNVDKENNPPSAGVTAISEATETNVESEGILPYAIQDFFKRKTDLESSGSTVDIEMSYLEIYNEKCYDLLSTTIINKDKDRERIKEIQVKTVNNEERPCLGNVWDNAKGETVLEGLTSWPVTDKNHASRLLCVAARARATGTTAMNAASSRSHAICTFYLKISTTTSGSPIESNTKRVSSSETVGEEDSVVNTDSGHMHTEADPVLAHTSGSERVKTVFTSSKFHLVDLAGSERIKKTQATGERLKEGININMGLLALGNVVEALSER